jgi:purine nucleosidase
MSTASMITMVLDSDGGVDDIAALWFALTCPEIDLRAITVTGGNVGIEIAADNLARVTHVAGRGDIPIALGEAHSYGPGPELNRPVGIHGEDGVGNTGRRPPPWTPDPRSAERLLADVVGDAPGEVTLVTLGPLRNVARFVDSVPDAVPLVGRLVVMGGTVALQGNCLPVCEANIAHDPLAAAVVAAASWSQPPLLIPLDVTLRATLGPDEFAAMDRGATMAAQDLREPLAFYRGMGSTFTPGACPCHDLTAVVAAVQPDLVTAPVLPFGVDTAGGLAWGSTVVDRRQPFFDRAGASSRQADGPGLHPWAIGLDADVEGFRRHYRWLLQGWPT